ALLFIFPYYIFVLRRSFGRLSRGKFLLSGFLILSAFAIFWFWVDKQSAFLIKERLIGSFYNSLNIRLETWSCSWEVFSSGSWWMGVGSGNEQLLLNECYYEHFLTRHFYSAYNTHSDMLLILMRNGLIGLGLWLVFLFYFLKRCFKNRFVLGIVFILLFVFSGLTEAYLSRIWGSLYFGAGVGLSMAYWQHKSLTHKQAEL
ncbi:MAG: O-antigen ligase family protein, partial [Flavobacteriaceae bacterium]